MSNMYKSRKGAALIMALVVVLVGGGVIAITFNMVFRYAWFSPAERAGFVDHTTALDVMHEIKARIVQANINGVLHPNGGGRVTILHAVGLRQLQDNWDDIPDPRLDINALIIDEFSEIRNVADGVGQRRVEITVFDLFFNPLWIADDALRDPDFPPIIKIGGEITAAMTPDGESTSFWGGSSSVEADQASLGPDIFGSYLIRVRLFDGRHSDPIRTMEEAFVQVVL